MYMEKRCRGRVGQVRYQTTQKFVWLRQNKMRSVKIGTRPYDDILCQDTRARDKVVVLQTYCNCIISLSEFSTYELMCC